LIRRRDTLINRWHTSNNPPELRAAYDRKLSQGEDEEYTRQRIFTVFAFVRFDELITNNPFYIERFLRLLNALHYIDPKEGITGFDLVNM
jgi:hypothetical protein